MVTVGGLFSGIGGIELGFEKAGFKILWSNEFDENCNKTFRHNLNHKLYSESITDINFKKIKPVDVLVGGFPCQAFSVAGYRKGFKDERGNLFFQICRAIEELKTKPKVLMLENVKNLTGHDKGKTARVIVNSLRELGYSVFWKIFNTFVQNFFTMESCDYKSKILFFQLNFQEFIYLFILYYVHKFFMIIIKIFKL